MRDVRTADQLRRLMLEFLRERRECAGLSGIDIKPLERKRYGITWTAEAVPGDEASAECRRIVKEIAGKLARNYELKGS